MVVVRRIRLFVVVLVCGVTVTLVLGATADGGSRTPTVLHLTTDHVPNGPFAADPLRFHVWVQSAGAPSSTSNGTVTLKIGGSVIGAGQVPANDGTVHITTAGLTAGEKTVTAHYAGGPTWEPSQTSLVVDIVPRDLTSTVLVNGCTNRHLSGGSRTCHVVGGENAKLDLAIDRTAPPSSDPNLQPTGEVIFSVSGPDQGIYPKFGPDVVARAPIDDWFASATTRDLPVLAMSGGVGCYTLTGEYTGDAYFDNAKGMETVCAWPPDSPNPGSGSDGGDTQNPPVLGGSGPARLEGSGTSNLPMYAVDASAQGGSSKGREISALYELVDGKTRTTPLAGPSSGATPADDRFGAATNEVGQSNGLNAPLAAGSGGLGAIALGLLVAASIAGPWAPKKVNARRG